MRRSLKALEFWTLDELAKEYKNQANLPWYRIRDRIHSYWKEMALRHTLTVATAFRCDKEWTDKYNKKPTLDSEIKTTEDVEKAAKKQLDQVTEK